MASEGRRAPQPWYVDASGELTDDPSVITADLPGAILPIGGMDHGHKGYGLALTIEALTQGLSAYGRAGAPTRWGAAVYVQALDPAAFGGVDAFRRETGWLRSACEAVAPIKGIERVRLPGDAALARRRQAEADGVETLRQHHGPPAPRGRERRHRRADAARRLSHGEAG